MPNELIIQLPPDATSLDAAQRQVRASGLTDAKSVSLCTGPDFNTTATALTSAGLRIAATVTTQPLIDPLQPDLFDPGYPAWCDALVAARAHAIPLVIGSLAEKPARLDDVFRFAAESLRKIRFDAERCSARLAVRTSPALALSDNDLRELIDEANSYWIGLELDLDAGASPARTADSLALLTHRVIAVRLKNPTPPRLAETQSTLAELQLDAPIVMDLAASIQPTR